MAGDARGERRPVITAEDQGFMSRALRLAREGLYTTHPNPRVGCVLVRDGETVGEGWHARAGGPHAEVVALRRAGERARGATAYVTLEPCCHQGRTPPCTKALVSAGVVRVVAAMRDPNPQVAGKGLEELRRAGMVVLSGLLETQARALNAGFVKRMEQGLPWLRLKIAASLDGRTAMANGESKWITGDAARLDVHRLRARSSAVLTGVDTVLADDPLLNVRIAPERLGLDPGATLPAPRRVILDSRLRTPPGSRLLDSGDATLICAVAGPPERAAALEARGAQVVFLPAWEGRLDLRAVLEYLARCELNEITVEAGPTLAGALVNARLVDELLIYQAPVLMGDSARGMFRLPGLKAMEERIALEITDVRAVGNDLRITSVLR